MKLHSPRFERALRRRVRHTVRRSTALRRQRRARRHAQQAVVLPALLRLGRVGILLWLLSLLGAHGASAAALVAFAAVWFSFLAFQRAYRLLAIFHGSPDIYALNGLPVSHLTRGRWLWHQFIRQSLWFALDSLVATVVILWPHIASRSSFVWAAAILAAALQWFTCLSLAVLLARRLAQVWHGAVASAGFLLAIATLAGQRLWMPVLSQALDAAAPWLNLILPTAWPLALLGSWTRPGHVWFLDWAMLVPVAALSAWAWLERHRLGDGEVEPPSTDAAYAAVSPSAEPERQPEQIAETIRSRRFLQAFSETPAGWIEQQFRRRLTRRDLLLLDALRSGPEEWLGRVRVAAVLLGIALIAGESIGAVWAGIAVAIAAIIALPDSGLGRVFASSFMSGAQIPFHAGVPIGFREISRLVLRVNAVRTLLAAPLFLAYAMTVAWLLHLSPLVGFVVALKAMWIAWCCMPILLTLQFSGGTNDTRRLTLATLGLCAVAILAAGGTLTLAILLFRVDAPQAWLCAALLPWPLRGLHRFYGWVFDRRAFDLLADPRNQ